MDFRRGAAALAAEDQAVAFLELRVPEAIGRLSGEEPETFRTPGRSQEGLPVGVMTDVEFVPVVHAGTAELGVVDLEAQRMHQVQDAARHGAHAPDVAGVRRDLRAEQDEMERRLHFRRLIAREISRLASRSLMSWRLSCIFLPLPTARRHFARPCLK